VWGHNCNPSTREAETGGLRVGGQPGLQWQEHDWSRGEEKRKERMNAKKNKRKKMTSSGF
jgi:hypothetical protein